MKLPKSEEDLMQHLWSLKKAFMKDLMGAYQEPKPASTTVSTLLKRLQEKEFVSYEAAGKLREYYPLISKETYFSGHLKGLIKNFFNDSPAQFASFFTKQTDLTADELKELKSLIEDQLDKNG